MADDETIGYDALQEAPPPQQQQQQHQVPRAEAPAPRRPLRKIAPARALPPLKLPSSNKRMRSEDVGEPIDFQTVRFRHLLVCGSECNMIPICRHVYYDLALDHYEHGVLHQYELNLGLATSRFDAAIRCFETAIQGEPNDFLRRLFTQLIGQMSRAIDAVKPEAKRRLEHLANCKLKGTAPGVILPPNSQ